MSVTYPVGPMRVRFAAETHVGRKRAHNEDAFHLPGGERLAIVADGMGGHASGEVASSLAVATLTAFFRDTDEEPETTWPFKMVHGLRYHANRLVTGIKLANSKIWEAAQANQAQHGMGTTVVAALFLDQRVVVAHVGDSRVYRLRTGTLTQLTDDHSLVNDYMKMKNLRADEVGNFPQKNVIVRALGMKESVQVDVFLDQPQVGDIYLLCSDGLTGMVQDGDIAQILSAEADLDVACTKLVVMANEHGGTDNITALLGRLERSSPTTVPGHTRTSPVIKE